MNNLLKANKLLIIYWFKSKLAIKFINTSDCLECEKFRFQINYGKGKMKKLILRMCSYHSKKPVLKKEKLTDLKEISLSWLNRELRYISWTN